MRAVGRAAEAAHDMTAGCSGRARRLTALRSGAMSEWLAAALLMLKGYRILARRVRSRAGEIDIVAARGRRIAFIEVKRRTTPEEAEASIGDTQVRRIGDAAERWVWRHRAFRDHEIGLDAVLIVPGRWPRHIPNALAAR